MLKAFDDIQLSKSMYVKPKNMIITASRGRRIKVSPLLCRLLPHYSVLGNTLNVERRDGSC